MRKAILLGMILVFGSVVFAQKYPYTDENYQAVAKQVAEGKRVEAFPDQFFIDIDSDGMIQDGINLYYELKDAYENNRQSFNAIMNYADGLMQYPAGYMDIPSRNNDIARKLLKEAKAINPNDVHIYQCMMRLLDSKISPVSIVAGIQDQDYLNAPVDLARAYLSNFEKRVALQDKDLDSNDYYKAAFLSKRLGRSEQANAYEVKYSQLVKKEEKQWALEMAKFEQEQAEAAQKAKKEQEAKAKKAKTLAQKQAQEALYNEMLESMLKGWK